MALKGFRFPVVVSPTRGQMLTTEESKQIESDLLLLLVTEPGSRPFRRDYGVGISLLLQEPNDQMLQTLMKRLIIEGVTLFEPRVLINDVQFKTTDSTLTIILVYELQTNEQENVTEFNFPKR